MKAVIPIFRTIFAKIKVELLIFDQFPMPKFLKNKIIIISIIAIISIMAYLYFANQSLVFAQTANIYYVSPIGTAAWANCGGATPLNGTAACSWQTAMANAVADDIVYFRGGTYDLGVFDGERGAIKENTRMFPANSGTVGNPIIFAAYQGETPNITGTVTASSQEAWFGCGYSGAERNYIIWDGFSAIMIKNQGSYETAIFRVVGDYCTVKNMNFTGIDVGNNPDNTAFIRIENATNGLIENNYMTGLVSASYTAVNTAAIYFNMLSNLNVVRNNTIIDSEGGIYGKGNSANVSIYNNFIFNSANSCDRGVWYTKSTTLGESTSIRSVYQNIIVGCRIGVWFENNNPTSGGLIYNNVIYANNDFGGGIEIQSDHANTQIFNNIIYNQSPSVRYYNGTVSYSDYNDFYNISGNVWNCAYSSSYASLSAWTASGVSCRPADYDDNSLTANPNLINPGGANPADYKLQFGSPALTSGRGGSYASVMGAYITGDEIIGYIAPIQVDTASPSAPTGLVVN